MPTSDPGRRDNGLAAADWGALVDLDPRLSASVLQRLAEAGVAAYVEPAGGVDTLHRAVTLPDRPLDRLWVDPERAEAARTVIAALAAEIDSDIDSDIDSEVPSLVRAVPRGSARRVLAPPRLSGAPDPNAGGLTDDEVFRQIVAGFADESPDPVPRWPAQEDDGPARQEPPKRQPHRRQEAELPAWVEPDEVAPAAEDHYVPPPPPPLRRLRASTVLAALGIVLGVLVAFAPDLVGLRSGNDTRLLGMVLLGSGAGWLIWSMHDRPDGGDPDEGAVV